MIAKSALAHLLVVSFAVVSFVVVGVVLLAPRMLRWIIRRRLGGYRRAENTVDPTLPLTLGTPKRVAVLGGGVAGLTAALTLARRGYRVTLMEKNRHLGGKLGSFEVELANGEKVWVSHGFHAFFPHYYNLNRILDSLGLRQNFTSIGDYVILGRSGQVLRFAKLATTPVLNLFSLLRAGMFTLKDALGAPGRDMYGIFLEYDPVTTFEQWDTLSYADFSRLARVPPRLKLAFNTFARAFFADEDRLSLAELVKSFHFYYLSHDGGLLYEYPIDDYDEGLLRPLKNALEELGVGIVTGKSAGPLRREGSGFFVDEEHFDKVVVATDVVGVARILGEAQAFPPGFTEAYSRLRPGQRYGVLRVWLDRDVREGLPVFVITEKVQVLDSVTLFHRFERQAKRSMDRVPDARAVLELHCYSVPDGMNEHDVREVFLKELEQFFPELEGAQVLAEHFQLNQDFTSFHVGQAKGRPGVETEVAGLYCAGDWVKLPFPAMLLECACASGLCAANGILKEDGLREELVESVPLRGLMAGFPSPPGREPLIRAARENRPGALNERSLPDEAPRCR